MNTSEPARHSKGRQRSTTVARVARQMPRNVMHELNEHPAAVLATVAGASFAAGAVLGSRLGRALLVALMPAGLSYAVTSGVGEDLREWLVDALSEGSRVRSGPPG